MIRSRPFIGTALCTLILTGACSAAPEAPQPAPATTKPVPGTSKPAPPASPLPLKSDQVLSHVSRTVDWYHGLQSVEQLAGTPQDLLMRDRLHDQIWSCSRSRMSRS